MTTEPLSLVVLPFVNLTGVQHHDVIVNGVTDRLTSELASIENSFVVARAAALVYRGCGRDADEIGQELGVRYVIRGSVRARGDGLWIIAQLIDTADGLPLWTTRFDAPAVGQSALPGEIVNRLMAPLRLILLEPEWLPMPPAEPAPPPVVVAPVRRPEPRIVAMPAARPETAASRVPSWFAAIKLSIVSAVGAVALYLLGAEPQSAVAVVSFILIATGIVQLAGNLVHAANPRGDQRSMVIPGRITMLSSPALSAG